MLNPYHVIGQALALFKAAGLPVPAYGEEAAAFRCLGAALWQSGR